MRAADFLKRLKKAMQGVAVLPEDAPILAIQIDGLGDITGDDNSYIQLGIPFEKLVEANVIGAGSWVTREVSKEKYLEDSISTGGFNLIHLRDRKTALGATNTESGKRAEAQNQDTLIIGKEGDEVK